MKQPKFPVPVDKPVKFAFEIIEGTISDKEVNKGIKFYEFVDFNEMPVKRALHSLTFLNEVSQKLTKERLIAFLDAMEGAINSETIKMAELLKLIVGLRERTEMIFEPESVYKLASVVYFTEDENPNDYSMKQGYRNMDLFKTVKDHDFFLSVPIKKCTPQHSLSDSDLITYLEIVKKINKKELTSISTLLSNEARTKDSFNMLKSLNLQD